MKTQRLTLPGRRVLLVAVVPLLIVLVLLVGFGWYYSSLLRSDALTPDYSPKTLNLQVVRVTDSVIVLQERPGYTVDSIDDSERWGLEGATGYGQVGGVLGQANDEVTREFSLLSGSITAGDYVRLDSFAFDGDPRSARGLAFEEVEVPSPLGNLPAWKLDGTLDQAKNTWVIVVHGWRSDRDESLRILPTISSLGLSSLVITYRNDEGAPGSEDGLIRWGATEWQDLEAAVKYARSQGARSVILYGFSMGGGIAVRFLEQSPEADIVTGAILDSPVLSFEDLLDFQADRRHIPGFLVDLGKLFAGRRFGLDWDAIDPLSQVAKVHVPVLLFHGTDDERAPIETSRRFAAERSDIVTYVEVEGAGHVRSWNVDPDAYQAKVAAFLTSLLGR